MTSNVLVGGHKPEDIEQKYLKKKKQEQELEETTLKEQRSREQTRLDEEWKKIGAAPPGKRSPAKRPSANRKPAAPASPTSPPNPALASRTFTIKRYSDYFTISPVRFARKSYQVDLEGALAINSLFPPGGTPIPPNQIIQSAINCYNSGAPCPASAPFTASVLMALYGNSNHPDRTIRNRVEIIRGALLTHLLSSTIYTWTMVAHDTGYKKTHLYHNLNTFARHDAHPPIYLRGNDGELRDTPFDTQFCKYILNSKPADFGAMARWLLGSDTATVRLVLGAKSKSAFSQFVAFRWEPNRFIVDLNRLAPGYALAMSTYEIGGNGRPVLP